MEDDPIQLSDEFKSSMKEWVELKSVLTNARKDLKALSDRERNLKTYLKGAMAAQKIDKCNLRKGKVSLNKKQAKMGITKDTIARGLLEFFQGDKEKAQGAYDAIQTAREVVERSTLSLTGLKTKGEE